MNMKLPERIRTDRDLDDFWRVLMEPLGFGARRLWLVAIEPDGVPIKELMQVDDVPTDFRERDAAELMTAFGEPLVEQLPEGSLAILFSRPGRNPMDAADRRLASEIIRAAARARVPLRPVFFANDVTLRIFAVDDLLLAGSSH